MDDLYYATERDRQKTLKAQKLHNDHSWQKPSQRAVIEVPVDERVYPHMLQGVIILDSAKTYAVLIRVAEEKDPVEAGHVYFRDGSWRHQWDPGARFEEGMAAAAAAYKVFCRYRLNGATPLSYKLVHVFAAM